MNNRMGGVEKGWLEKACFVNGSGFDSLLFCYGQKRTWSRGEEELEETVWIQATFSLRIQAAEQFRLLSKVVHLAIVNCWLLQCITSYKSVFKNQLRAPTRTKAQANNMIVVVNLLVGFRLKSCLTGRVKLATAVTWTCSNLGFILYAAIRALRFARILNVEFRIFRLKSRSLKLGQHSAC